MTVQRPIAPIESPDYEFRRQYSRHKVWIAFKNGQESKTHYAKDCSATLQQLQWKKVVDVVLSQQASMDDCLRLERHFRGKYRTLQIYRRGANGKFPNEPIIKFVNGKMECLIEDDSLPPDVHCQVLYGTPPEGAPKGTPYPFRLVPFITKQLKLDEPAPPPPKPTAADKQKARLITDRSQAIATKWRIN